MNKRCAEILANLEKQGKIKVNHGFQFPEPIPLEKKLKDVLEKEVDEKYYLSEDRLNVIYEWEKRQKENGRGFRFEVKDGNSIGRAVTTNGDRPSSTNYVAIKTANKTGYDLATDGDGIDLAYPDSKTRRGRVGHGVSKTLPTSDSQGVLLKKGDNDAENQRNTEILPILRKEIGEKTFQEWAIGGLWCILSEAVLWERVYAPSVYKNWIEQPKLVEFAYFGKNNKPTVSTQESVRNMWIDWQDRYSSYRRELPEQLSREFTSVVQELPHEVASWQRFVQDLRKASEGLGILRQALSEIQKIWQPDARWEVQRSSMRIRKLTPLSCWRLMGFDDEDFHKAEKINSNTQLYKQAGNSICVDVLMAILRQLLV